MPQRTDPMFYEFDILERKTQEVRRVPIQCWWSGDASINERQRMCDCQLGAFWNEWAAQHKHRPDAQVLDFGRFFDNQQFEYLNKHKCDHRPSKKFQVLRAHVGGDVIEIAA